MSVKRDMKEMRFLWLKAFPNFLQFLFCFFNNINFKIYFILEYSLFAMLY